MKDSGEYYPYAVVKTKEFSMITGERNIPLKIETYKDNKYRFSPFTDDVIKDAIINIEDGVMEICGTKIIYRYLGSKYEYGEKFWMCDVDKKIIREQVLYIIEFVKTSSKNNILLTEDDVKIGYESLWNRIKGKQTFYLKTTKALISCTGFIDINEIKENFENSYYVEGWVATTFKEQFQMTATNFSINKNS